MTKVDAAVVAPETRWNVSGHRMTNGLQTEESIYMLTIDETAIAQLSSLSNTPASSFPVTRRPLLVHSTNILLRLYRLAWRALL